MADQLLSSDPKAGQLLSADLQAGQLLSSDPGAASPMTFAIVNGQRVPVEDDDPNTVGTFARHVGAALNPLESYRTLVAALPLPEGLGGKGWSGPIDSLKAIGAAQGHVGEEAKAAYDKGDYLGAAAHALYYLLPLVGPALDKAGNEMRAGKLAAGAGDAVGLGLSTFGPEAVSRAAVSRVTRAASAAPEVEAARLNPMEAASVEFAHQRDVPLDAATETGSRTLRAAEKRVSNSMGGEGTAERLIGQQARALSRVGGELAADAHPDAVSPELAGDAVSRAMQAKITELHGSATDWYERLRQMERDPANAAEVPGQSPEAQSATKAVQDQMQISLGRIPSDKELRELRRIKAELDALPFKQGKLVSENPGVSSETHYDPRAAGAPVYHDILDAAPGSSSYTRGEMREAIDTALTEGKFTNAARGALDVARKRLRGDPSISKPYLPPSAGDIATPTQTMLLPVDIRGPKAQLRPMYEQLKREAELVPLQGGKAQALVALDRLLNGPDHAPVSVVDRALSDLKSMARGADLPELRSDAQGVAAGAVKHLDAAVRQAVERAGPDAVQALERGRAATMGKFYVADVLDQLAGQGRQEPVALYRKLTLPKDSGIRLLREVAGIAPAEMPHIARGYLEDLLAQATADGGFGKAGRLQAEWRKLGTQTKAILFPKAGQAEALDHFFLLAKRIAENPNPSGTAHANNVFNVLSQPGYWAVAKLLYTPAGVRAVTKFLAMTPPRVPVGTVPALAQTAGWSNVVAAAKAAGVPLGTEASR